MEAVSAADRELLATTAAAIDAERSVFAKTIVEKIYDNPFWQARYGESGRARSLDDVERNLGHLSASLRLELREEVVRHYRWLRELLVLRGMCTQQLREGVEITATVLAVALAPEQAAISSDWLMRAGLGLGDDADFSIAVAANEQEIIAGALERLSAGSKAEYTELRYLLSYLSDAICSGRPDLFTAHISWLAGLLEDSGVSPSVLRAQLEALGAEIEQRVPEHATQAHTLIADAVNALPGSAAHG